MTADVPREAARSRFTVRLIGGDVGDGEIPLDRLADIAQRTQELVRGLARELSGRAGPGTSPKQLRAATQLLLVGMHPGSTALEFAGPPLETELDFDGDLPPEVGTQAIERLELVLEGAALDPPRLPDDLEPSSRTHLVQFLDALRPYDAVEIGLGGPGERTEARLEPRRVAPAVRRLESEPPQPPAAQLTVEGVLYALNLRTGRFLVEDDLGHQIDFVVPPQLRPSAVRLAGARVAVSGRGEPHRAGLRLLDVDAVEPAPDPEGVDTLVFRTDADLEQRLASRAPLASLDELAIPGLSEPEAAAFLSALGE